MKKENNIYIKPECETLPVQTSQVIAASEASIEDYQEGDTSKWY